MTKEIIFTGSEDKPTCEEDAEEHSVAHWDNMIVFLNGVVAALKAENLSYPLICPTCDGAGDIVTKLGESTGEYMDDRIISFPEYAPCKDCQGKGFLIKKSPIPSQKEPVE